MWAKGEHTRWSVLEEVHEGGAAHLPEIEHRPSELGLPLQSTDGADRLTEQTRNLRRQRRRARATAPVVTYRPVEGEGDFADVWAAATTVEARRAALDDAIAGIVVHRGRVGHGLDKGRLTFTWHQADRVGPLDVPDQETLAAIRRFDATAPSALL